MSAFETARNGFAIIGILVTSGVIGLVGWHAVVALRRWHAGRYRRLMERARSRAIAQPVPIDQFGDNPFGDC